MRGTYLIIIKFLSQIIASVLLLYLFIALYVTVIHLSMSKIYMDIYMVIYATALLIVTADFILNIIFVVGAHSVSFVSNLF